MGVSANRAFAGPFDPAVAAAMGRRSTARRLTRPLRQQIDFQFVRIGERPVVEPELYDRSGRRKPASHRRLLDALC